MIKKFAKCVKAIVCKLNFLKLIIIKQKYKESAIFIDSEVKAVLSNFLDQ